MSAIRSALKNVRPRQARRVAWLLLPGVVAATAIVGAGSPLLDEKVANDPSSPQLQTMRAARALSGPFGRFQGLRHDVVGGNWAGYVVTESPPYLSVQGTWTVPLANWVEYP